MHRNRVHNTVTTGGVDMRFVTVRELRAGTAQLWAELPEEGEVVVTNNGRPVAILTPVDEAGLEAALSSIRRARAGAALDRIQRASLARGGDKISDAEIEAEIAAVRASRRS